MYLYVLIVFWDGYNGTNGEVQGHFRTREDAIKRGLDLTTEPDVDETAEFNVYKCVF